MASNLQSVVAALNSKPPTPSSADPEKKKKPPAKPRAPKDQSATKSKLKVRKLVPTALHAPQRAAHITCGARFAPRGARSRASNACSRAPQGGTADGLPTGTKPSALSSRIGQPGGGGGSSSAPSLAAAAPTPSSTALGLPNLMSSMNYSAPVYDPATAPLLKRLKDVLDALLARNGSQVLPAELLQATRLNLATDAALLREVHRHERITWDGAPRTPEAKAAAPPPAAPAKWYAYLPEIAGIRDKVGLLNYVRDKGPAVLADQLRRCYLKAPDDLAELKSEGKVFIVGHTDPEKVRAGVAVFGAGGVCPQGARCRGGGPPFADAAGCWVGRAEALTWCRLCAHAQETVFVRDMMGQDVVQEDVRALWFEVCQEHVKDHVPADVHELQIAVGKAGAWVAHRPHSSACGWVSPPAVN